MPALLRQSLLGRSLAGAIAATVLLAGCGTNVATPLPDLKTKSAPPNGGPGPMTAAEQKRAVDELIAKRDGK